MTLHPITVVDRVLDEYRAHLATEFRASDDALRAALEAALDTPGFLAREPFFQAHRPFKAGRAWRDLGLDGALARVMEERSRSETAYLHQSQAIERLLGEDAGPLVVTTGTGSGKTESFLLPVIQNALEDSVRYQRSALTAILVYPMNALANDQEERIREYLELSGHTHVQVARYDRSTKQEERARLRKAPPHVLLTNYMMLEYLLVRPADRDALFANHRCRFVVLDEVHTYRGSLGANIALLFRRLRAHLKRATQDWRVDDEPKARRFPAVVAVGTSATIKSVDEAGRTREEVRALRDAAVQEFFARLTGEEEGDIAVIGEELRALSVPAEAAWPPRPVALSPPVWDDAEAVRAVMQALAGKRTTDLAELGRHAGILWKLNALLAKKPMSLTQIIDDVLATVPERSGAGREAVTREVATALVAGAALPDGTPGALRLRTHRFIRGGWRFTRCVSPECGRLYPMGEERCECGHVTAPLYLCRSCGADSLRFRKDTDGDESGLLTPNAERTAEGEWMLYDRGRFEAGDDEGLVGLERHMRKRPVLTGSFDPATGAFSTRDGDHPMRVALAPARNRCLVCGATAGAYAVMTPVGMGTSAAVRVLAEGLVEGLAAQRVPGDDHDGKERLLIFSDSRQDAAHQARFITYAGRYDRMRRRLVRALERAPEHRLTIEQALTALVASGVEHGDNPHTAGQEDAVWLSTSVRARAAAWEEAPLLDDLAVSVGYRASVFNLGLAGVVYDRLEDYVAARGGALAVELGLTTGQLAHICRCLLDEVRRRGALSRPLLRYHPASPSCPEEFRSAADWERRVKAPRGYACTEAGAPELNMDADRVPEGITLRNAWRKAKAGGRAPSLERIAKHLVARMDGVEVTEEHMRALLRLLTEGPGYLVPAQLHGYKKSRQLLQVNADTVILELLPADERRRCSICYVRLPGATIGAPCPACRGVMEPWPAEEVDASRYVQRIRNPKLLPLVAGEHTAQVTGDDRIVLEERFKAPPPGGNGVGGSSAGELRSPVNVLACSPTLEMGIDVGGLDAVVMRNVPPRPDNYAQRGGRAGRRSRVGVVLGYARSTPHDGYFFDKPAEMIAGEVAAPGLGLGNRDVVARHLHAIVFGASEPGLAGRMAHYVTVKGELAEEHIDELIKGLEAQFDVAADIALDAWGPEILGPPGLARRDAVLTELRRLPGRIRELFDRVRRQIVQLGQTIDRWYDLQTPALSRAATHAVRLKHRLLGLRDARDERDADDRTGGHPMRRFAEFGILPGYEFPSEPASLRLWGDDHEEEPVSVTRRFGLGQFQPEALVHARGHRWKVVGLDLASAWNPKSPSPDWVYYRCKGCELRYSAQKPACPRCGSDETVGAELPGHEFGGFLAIRSDTPVLQEEDRFATAALVGCHPQRDGRVTKRYRLATGWRLVLRVEETVRWVNEWKPPSARDLREGRPVLHDAARGFYLCEHCGQALTIPDQPKKKTKGRAKAKKGLGRDVYGHAKECPSAGKPPIPKAVTTSAPATTLRITVVLPRDLSQDAYRTWGLSLGYAMRQGMRQLYTLDGTELEFLLEPMWTAVGQEPARRLGALTFIDAAVGGSGFLERAARELHLSARRTIEHLDHEGCQSACYRCLKSYRNQRHHEHLSWPEIMPDLQQLASAPPEERPLERGDGDDPRPWLEAYDAGVGSPLELAFLRIFERHGIEVDKQVAVAAEPGGPMLSQADFQVRGSKVLIYIDGAAFHRGRRLRRDQWIREQLARGGNGWRVLTLTSQDRSDEEVLMGRVRRAVSGGS